MKNNFRIIFIKAIIEKNIKYTIIFLIIVYQVKAIRSIQCKQKMYLSLALWYKNEFKSVSNSSEGNRSAKDLCDYLYAHKIYLIFTISVFRYSLSHSYAVVLTRMHRPRSGTNPLANISKGNLIRELLVANLTS